MTALPNRKLTVAEYLAIERQADSQSESYRGERDAVPGASGGHDLVKQNLVIELFARLRGTPGLSFPSDQRVKVSASGLYTYPDIVLVCGRAEFLDNDSLLNPDAIIEVLSPATETYDRVAKFRQYQQLPSLQEYVLVSQDDPWSSGSSGKRTGPGC